MILTSSVDKSFNKRTQKAVIKLKQGNEVEINVASATSSSKRKIAENSTAHCILRNTFRPRSMSIVENGADASQNAIIFDAKEPKQIDPNTKIQLNLRKMTRLIKKLDRFRLSLMTV